MNIYKPSYQVKIRGLRQQFNISAATVNASLEVHLIPEDTWNIISIIIIFKGFDIGGIGLFECMVHYHLELSLH